jgi:putative two-component system response regulator
MMKALCEELRKLPEYEPILTPSYITELFETAPLHDIGKVGIPDNILLKPSKLTHEEFEVMKMHTTYGINALQYEAKDHEMPTFIQTAINCISGHHERYDGTGYPLGLSGEAIPLAGRLMSVIDVYDALISKRVYKQAYEHDYAIALLKEGRGSHFDPTIVDAFLRIQNKITQITATYGHI